MKKFMFLVALALASSAAFAHHPSTGGSANSASSAQSLAGATVVGNGFAIDSAVNTTYGYAGFTPGHTVTTHAGTGSMNIVLGHSWGNVDSGAQGQAGSTAGASAFGGYKSW